MFWSLRNTNIEQSNGLLLSAMCVAKRFEQLQLYIIPFLMWKISGKSFLTELSVKQFSGFPRSFLKHFWPEHSAFNSSCIESSCIEFCSIVRQKRAIFGLPKPAVQHLSTCVELFAGVSRNRIWLITLSEIWTDRECHTFVQSYRILGWNIRWNVVSLCRNVGAFNWNNGGFSLFFLFARSCIFGDKIAKKMFAVLLDIVYISQNVFSIYFKRVDENRFISVRKFLWAVPFRSDTSLNSALCYPRLICIVIDHFDQFRNGPRKIKELSWNAL